MTNQESISVFPNPSLTGQFKLSQASEWEVFSMEGIMLAKGGELIDLTNNLKGAYFLKMDRKSSFIIIQ